MHCHFLSKLKEIFRIPPTGDFYSLHSTWFAVLDIENNSLDDESLSSLAQHVSLFCRVVTCNKNVIHNYRKNCARDHPTTVQLLGRF